jgi:membrane protein YqaA with SNARE-associated domain
MHKVVLWIQTVLVPMLGAPGMFVVAFLDSSFLSFPEINDILLVTSSSLHPGHAWIYAIMTTLGSLAGCLVMWELGRRGGEAFLVRRFGAARVEKTRAAFQRWDVLTIAIPAVLPPPMPFKIFVVSAGVFGFSMKRLALTLLVARGLRYAFWAAMGAFYGDEALDWLERFDAWFADHGPMILVWILAVAVAVLVVYAARTRRARPGAGEA